MTLRNSRPPTYRRSRRRQPDTLSFDGRRPPLHASVYFAQERVGAAAVPVVPQLVETEDGAVLRRRSAVRFARCEPLETHRFTRRPLVTPAPRLTLLEADPDLGDDRGRGKGVLFRVSEGHQVS